MPQPKKPQKKTERAKRSCQCVAPEVKLKAVKLFLEEGLPRELICEQLGVNAWTMRKWVTRYRREGEEGFKKREGEKKAPRPASQRLHAKIVEVKAQQPASGVKRISQWMRRMLFVQASPETVRQVLHQEGLMPSTKKKPPRNPPKPRFFERSTPNQLWQSDICTFRLGGSNAYLIGFVDDYSRYVVGLGLYRSQTAENVLEVYRRAVGEYGPPKEMLTDHGRQYANWRGKTRFQMELAKDKIHHLMSRPHHPMTLGKVERFWKTIWEEFLVRAQFGSFEEAQDRLKYWLQYYNHQRPHQGLDGMCPADRFFEIARDLRQVIEAGIKDNAQQLALNREPKEPFYMVGRMGSQSLVLRVEKGQFQMQVNDGQPSQETPYPLGEKSHDSDRDEGEAGAGSAQREGKGPGGLGLLDGAKAAQPDLPGAQDHDESAESMAGARDGGYIDGAGAEGGEDARAQAVAAGEAGAASGAENHAGGTLAAVEASQGPRSGEGAADAGHGQHQPSLEGSTDEQRGSGGPGQTTGGNDCPGAQREADGQAGGSAAGRVAQDVLPVGAPGASGNDAGAARPEEREALQTTRRADAGDAETAGGVGGTRKDTPAGGTDPDGHR